MAFCGKCGAALSAGMSFCVKCGAPVEPTGDAGGSASGAPTPLAPNIAAVLSYVLGFVTGILFLVLDPYRRDSFVRFHAFQSIFFSLLVLVWFYLTNIIFWMLFSTVGILGTLYGFASSLVSLAIFVFWLFLMYKAYNREQYRIPVLGDLAAKQAG